MTIDSIVKELTDGLEYTETQLNEIKTWLVEYQTANQLSLQQLNELCWKDSDWVFNNIF